MKTINYNRYCEAIEGTYYYSDVNLLSGQFKYREAKVEIIAESIPTKYYLIKLKEPIRRHGKGDVMRVLKKNVKSKSEIEKKNKLPYWLI